MKNIRQLLENIAFLPFYLLTYLIPRKRNTWVFGAWFGDRYSDNSKYLYEYVTEHERSINAIWLTRNPEIYKLQRQQNRNVYFANSLKGWWYTARAGATFVTCGNKDISHIGRRGSVEVQLWHGMPLKKIRKDDKIKERKKKSFLFDTVRPIWMTLFPFDEENWDLFFVQSKIDSQRWKTAFGAADEQLAITGYPRADIILSKENTLPSTLQKIIDEQDIEKIALYAPTHRGEGKSDINLFESLQIEALQKVLEKHKILLIIKMHYFEASKASYLNKEPRIFVESQGEIPDINELLPFVDILITDYSSVYIDFLPLKRPIIFSPFDYTQYLSEDRDLYENYDKATPGEKCYSWTEVIGKLDDIAAGDDAYKEAREIKCQEYFEYTDGNNCERITNVVKDRLGLS